jgi:glycosyltransferase involved in cell wall biosynthesis
VVVDVQDLALPRETPWTASYAVWWAVDELYYRHGFFIVNATECARLYAQRARGRICLIPMASHHNVITPGPATGPRQGLTLGYIGTIAKNRGFPELIELVKNLRAEGLAVDLVINGNNPENLALGTHSWMRLSEKGPIESLAELLRHIHVGVIPYVDTDYWGLMSITKMAAYMAAGLPIVSFQLTETSNILARWKCGMAVDDWNGMAAAIRTLYHDRHLVETFGLNARKAAVQEYNWTRQAERLAELISGLTSGEYRPLG